ncbi:fumarylacetoacetate hydrolase family protein [Corynebacterium ammoniagenes]|uniref:2-hydroxyhepta-2,4-diene-1,7-dioate isomerase n=2 Tax=Corynebacterium ammoniagenes TaxID=1697 RepID=A0AAV5G2E3_CORAM|nr:fumarylacetoacetate hydrolase family protein [Corynebacterium ammoniagenes]APT83071.1 2-hydroxyhepta-2,4-diene-1,7-dioate isomerase [Corynebacterium ammoniagenes DSM 20306]AQS74103.1 2-hydroxyhepta-2,4-diene-1,7-dioate isomerase [Corynebacterium ammoniagenes]EFG82008.1 FAH family protein [Corynebacterium ammoniagenes DSM 20306]NMF31295.1 fumarylacetoacetate hydrolase family protein [Corynebacterium ammoniagenes]GJN42658.1 2-hydroxyhepta-2,4-diene-1,7-dioate isomerase [Corynebacterium ammoni
MKLATVNTAFGTTAVRIEGKPTSLSHSTMLTGIELDFDDVGALLRSGDWAKAAELSGEPMVFATEDLAPVVPHPEKIICVGLNYAKHIREMNRDYPEHPTLFIKFADALTGPYDDIYIPEYGTKKLDYEGELAVVIGKRAHRVTQKDALDHVAGYAIMNDYTLRDIQRQTTQFHAGKSFYRTAGFGPWLTTSDEWSPGNHARVRTTLDGVVKQDDDTDDLIFSVAQLIEFCSSLYPLNPGDVIVTGTPEGVGFARDEFIQDGQTVRIEIDGLGHIENTTHFGDSH